MNAKIKEHCIYCGGDIYYHGGENLIRCEWCGETLAVTKFESEQIRMQQTEEENKRIRHKLENAEKDKQAADDRLFSALSDLSKIRDEQDVLGKTLHLLNGAQEDAMQSLGLLKGISEKLVSSQNDIFAKMDAMQEIRALLQKIDMAQMDRQSVMNEFMLWSQQIREEDMKRLQGIVSSADELIEDQRQILEEVNVLKAAADQHQKTLESFQDQYTKDKLVKMRKLYRQAEDYQHDRRYDKAEEYYRRVLSEGSEDPEVYWRLIMCHYCLFYQRDDAGKMLPIILNPDLTDPAEMSLRKELYAHTKEQEKPYYSAKLQEIDRILDKYRLLKGQVQYDVFLSVKQDDGGHYTADSDVASDLYDFLTSHGIRVFNSRRTPIPIGHEYEPYIIAALISAKVMIVVGTTPDNMNSNWVKNEWSRFQWLQFREKEKTEKPHRILFCYLAKGMRAEQIPRALHPDRQAIYDGVKAQSDLLSALSFLIKTDPVSKGFGYTPTTAPKPDYGQIKKQMTAWLIIGKYEKVREKYDELLDEGLFLTHPFLHLAALCAEQKAVNIKQIIKSDFVLEDAPKYIAAIQLCDNEKEKQELEGFAKQNRAWREEKGNSKGTDYSKDTVFSSEQKKIEEWFKFGERSYDKEEYKEAAKWFLDASVEGHIEAQCRLGWIYLHGLGVEKDLRQAAYWYRKAAEKGEAKAQNNLGMLFELGDGMAKDLGQAFLWYQKAAEQGYVKSQTSLGRFFRFGRGTDKDLKQAFYWYMKAAEQGDKRAQFNIGRCYENGEGVESDVKQAVFWYIKSAEQGYAMSQYYLGKSYENGSGVQKDLTQAVYWYNEAAGQGHKDAQLTLGVCYEFGNGAEIDLQQAVYWYGKSAEQGNARAQCNLGWMYESGRGVEKDLQRAAYWYGKSAEQGNARAQSNLGWMYLSGNGIEKDLTQAVHWYRKSAEQGNAAAQNSLGNRYYYGEGIEKDLTQAIHWYRKSAEQGNADAQFNLGVCYEYGNGVEKDLQQAVYWYQKAAEQGYARAQSSLGWMYESGKGVDVDLAKAVYWYGKSAEQGYAYAQCNLGWMYESGKGVEKDLQQAVHWYQKAAEQGYARAQSSLGWMYESGKGVEVDLAKAVYWYGKSAEQGYAYAQCNLGWMYESGKGVEKDLTRAVYWYRKSAEQGHARAQCNLGWMYLNGNGIEKDLTQAVHWYRKSAEQGYAAAQNNLGNRYYYGEGVEKDLTQAVHWYRKSAEQGYARAQISLGNRYYYGEGVEKDLTQAVHWYQKSAEQGNTDALYNLGVCYELGNGVEKNLTQAVHWYTKAADQGQKSAKKRLAELKQGGLK